VFAFALRTNNRFDRAAGTAADPADFSSADGAPVSFQELLFRDFVECTAKGTGDFMFLHPGSGDF
jgi:hypothetical protein